MVYPKEPFFCPGLPGGGRTAPGHHHSERGWANDGLDEPRKKKQGHEATRKVQSLNFQHHFLGYIILRHHFGVLQNEVYTYIYILQLMIISMRTMVINPWILKVNKGGTYF